ncbi:hypothetical protein ALC56_02497, partial [Trachymyrmex septentrionalis]
YMYVKFRKTYGYDNHDALLFIAQFLVNGSFVVIDCSRQNESIKSATLDNNNNKTVKFNIKDILVIQHLYGIKNPKLTTTTTESSALTTEIMMNKPTSLGFLANVVINIAINTHRGQTYVIFDDNDVAQIDKCIVVCTINDINIPRNRQLQPWLSDGNIYFAKKQQFYKINEFTRIVTGKFSVKIFECSRDGLLQDILSQLIQSNIYMHKRGIMRGRGKNDTTMIY